MTMAMPGQLAAARACARWEEQWCQHASGG